MILKVSATKLNTFATCEYLYWLQYETSIKVPQWVKKVFGKAVHRTIQLFYKPNEKIRKARLEKGITQIFPVSQESAKAMWYLVWGQALKGEKADPGIFPGGCKIRFDGQSPEKIEQEKSKYYGLGASMIMKYWRDNYNAPFPIMMEKRFKIPSLTKNNVWFVGIMDQVRKKNGRAQIIDFKTGWYDFGERSVYIQFPIHKDPQFTIYSRAYRVLTNEVEAEIMRYPLGYKGTNPKTGEKIDKMAIITYRDTKDYYDLENGLLTRFIKFLEQEKPTFIKASESSGNACRFCDYLKVCQPKLFTTKPIPVSKINWGEIDKKQVITELTPRAEELDFHLPRLQFGKRK